MRIAYYQSLGSALSLAMLFAWSPLYAQDNPLPQERWQGSIAYLTGGIGSDESEAMRRAAASYPLMLELVAPGGGWHDQYVADAQVEIDDPAGKALLTTMVDGPLLLVRLPAGNYALHVAWNGAVERRNVTIARGEQQHVVFEFPRQDAHP